jgi:hypothetical protein
MRTYVRIFVHPLLTAFCRHNDRQGCLIDWRSDAEEYVTLIFSGRTTVKSTVRFCEDNEEFQH